MSDQWDWYRAAVTALRKGGKLPAVHDGKPESGVFYMRASKDGGRIPVLIKDDGNGEKCMVVGTSDRHDILSSDRCLEQWKWCCENVVVKADYMAAWDTGEWPDGTPTKAPDVPAGSNLPTDPFLRLQAEVDDKLASAAAFLNDAVAKPDKTRADRARNLQAELLSLNKTANNMHVAEKAPHLAAGRAVDAKFKFRETIEGVCVRLRMVFENILKAEEAKAREEARRKHAEETRKAEEDRQRILADYAKKVVDDPVSALTDPPLDLPFAPPAPEPVKVQAGGGIGRAAGLKTVWVPEIVDYEATLRHYAKHPDVRAVIEKLVKAEAKVHKEATALPGVKIREDRKAA